MKAGAAGINAHILLGQTTTTRLLNVQRLSDGALYGFTNLDQDLVFASVLYVSTTSFNPFNLNQKDTAEASSTELTGAFDSVITRADVIAGLWDNATFQLLLVNYKNLAGGAIILTTGSFGEFEPSEFGFKVALHGLAYPLTFIGGETCQPTCRVDFCSAKCAPGGFLDDGTDINSLLQTATVFATDGSRLIDVTGLIDTGKPFDGGLVTFLAGSPAGFNTDLSAEILHLDFATSPPGVAIITLRPWTQIGPIQIGDTLAVFPACDKTMQTCASVWANGRNFQGEPHVPGPDQSLAYPDYVAPHG